MLFDSERPLFKQIQPYFDLFHSYKPFILLPFNLWLFFVTLPFRLFFNFSTPDGGLLTKQNMQEMRGKVKEIKKDLVEKLPEQLKSKMTEEQKPAQKSKKAEEKPAELKKVDESRLERQKPKKSERSATQKVDPIAELKSKLAEFEKKEKLSSQEVSRLTKNFEELTSKLQSNEKSMESYKKEEQQYKTIIQNEQRKCFDLTQLNVQLRAKIARLEEAAEKFHEKPVEKIVEKPVEKIVESKKSKKAKKAKKVDAPQPLPTEAEVVADLRETEAKLEDLDPVNHPHGWHSAPQQHFTEMVAKAQQDELEHGKTFVEVLKEKIDTIPAEKTIPAKEDFLVIGGSESNHHQMLNPLSAK